MKTKECAASSIEAARALTQRGFYVVPIPSGNNHPVIDRWQNLRLTSDDLESHFADTDNVGILLAPSGLADVDLDCREAIAAADELLPKTAMIHGHLSSPRSHRYYLPTNIPKNKSFHDPRQDKAKSARAVIAELRTNGQTVVPPSINLRTGELVTWDSEGEPATVDGNVLATAVAHVAAAALLGRHWPNGSRHFATLALAGMLLRARWASDEVERFILAVGSAAQDEETSSRLSDVVSTAQRVGAEQPVTGAPTLPAVHKGNPYSEAMARGAKGRKRGGGLRIFLRSRKRSIRGKLPLARARKGHAELYRTPPVASTLVGTRGGGANRILQRTRQRNLLHAQTRASRI
jgi:hypothetical protein